MASIVDQLNTPSAASISDQIPWNSIPLNGNPLLFELASPRVQTPYQSVVKARGGGEDGDGDGSCGEGGGGGGKVEDVDGSFPGAAVLIRDGAVVRNALGCAVGRAVSVEVGEREGKDVGARVEVGEREGKDVGARIALQANSLMYRPANPSPPATMRCARTALKTAHLCVEATVPRPEGAGTAALGARVVGLRVTGAAVRAETATGATVAALTAHSAGQNWATLLVGVKPAGGARSLHP